MEKGKEERYEELLSIKKSGKRLNSKEYKEFISLGKELGRSNQGNNFKPGNDFSWWNKYPEIMNDAANLKCNWLAGTPLVSYNNGNLNVPGVLRVKMINSYGSETSVTDPLNVAARNIYLKLFSKFRGISSYEASDLAINFIATMEVFMTIAKLERIYGVINQYNMMNHNVPTTLLDALGITPTQADYLRGHLSDFRFDLNNLILKAQRIVLPKDMSVIMNKISLYGYVYLDHESERAQYVVFDYDRYGVFDETTLTTGGCIRFVTPADVNEALIDFTGTKDIMFPFLDYQLNQLLTSESILRMYGDLVAYFGSDQMLTVLPLPSDYTVKGVYSESILHKLHNLECVTTPDASVSADWILSSV